MYRSDIADNLKMKIDSEMNNLVNNTKLITLDQHITNINSKEELENMKSELLSYNEYVLSQQQTMEKQKVLVKVKEAGYVNTLVLSLIVIFVLGIAVGIGYMLFQFGV